MAEYTALARLSRTAPYLARRARIVLACADGHDNKTVAKRLRMSQTTVCKWRGRFVRERPDALYDEPGPGTPRQISDDQVEQVIVRTIEETPRVATHWSSRGMAKASGLGRTTVQQPKFHRRHRSVEFRQFLDAVRTPVACPRQLCSGFRSAAPGWQGATTEDTGSI
jgi:transposase